MSICLVMIVKDEARIIRRALMSVKPYIDSYRIIDTGSADETRDIIERELSHIPGELRESEWHDFGTNRSEAVKYGAGSGADWLLLMDADMVAGFADDFEEQLAKFDHDQALINVLGGVAYRFPYLVRNRVPWHYVGRTHEYINSDQPFTRGNFDGLTVTHLADGGSRADKFERDLGLLQMDLEDNPNNARSVFYVAQTYRDMGDVSAAREFYEKRAGMGGWDEEAFYALYQQGVMEDRLGLPEATLTLEAAYNLRPTRAEPAYQLARINRLRGRHHLALLWASEAAGVTQPDDILFVETDVYVWGAAFEYADAIWRVGYHRFLRGACEKLLRGPLPAEYREHVEMILGDLS